MDHWETITAERLALADTLDTLTPEQWASQSLCSAWTVGDVVAHLTQVVSGRPRDLLRALVKARGNPHRASELVVAEVAARPRSEIVAAYRSHATSHNGPPLLGPMPPLTDLLVHRDDIAVPLGLELDRPVDPWVPALDFLVSRPARAGFVGKGLPLLFYVATDVDWSHGSGEQVRGPASALGIAIAGRSAGLERLEGQGLSSFSAWVTG